MSGRDKIRPSTGCRGTIVYHRSQYINHSREKTFGGPKGLGSGTGINCLSSTGGLFEKAPFLNVS